MFTRHPANPLITPASIRPSRPDFEIIGTFNAGVIQHGDEVLLLLRVAERPRADERGQILLPYLTPEGELVVRRIAREDPNYRTNDPRTVRDLRSGAVYLTSISHLRLARSRDGVQFTIEEQPWLLAESPYEAYGVEDARITCIEGIYYINYTAVSAHGIGTALVSTTDFKRIQRHGLIFPPSNRDVVLFPRRIHGQYAAYHRPMPGDMGKYSIWSALSPDLVHWGSYQVVLEAGLHGWEAGRVGGGAPPVWTERGWLSIYHAADRRSRYCLGAFLAAHDDHSRLIARSQTPIFEPEAGYERDGFFPNVVFTCGLVTAGDVLKLYYGAADETLALAETSLAALLDALTPVA